MQFLCSHCEKNVEYSGERPRFCSHCGGSLHSTIGPDEQTLDVTLDATPDSTPQQSSSEVRFTPSTIGGYRLFDELGRGGMGTVYEAEEAATGRRVALKLLAPHASTSDDGVQRFLQEGRYAASLSHPRSTFVYAAGEDEGRLFIVMELMSGGTLKDLVDKDGPLPVTRAVDFMLDVIDGLQSAHAKNLIHRDLKPSNCFIDNSGRAKVGDFGLSKSLVADAGLTRTGAFMGTPMFAAPEQVKSQAVTVQTDIYAVGATLYHLLTGQGPYGGDAAGVIAAIVSEAPPSMRSHRAEIPLGLDRTVAWAMEKDVEKRPQSLADLRERLEPFSGREASFADLGRRLAAFSIDGFVITNVTTFVLVLLAIPAMIAFKAIATLPLTLATASAVIVIGYFAFAEWRWGKGVGKYIMGLRVTNEDGAAPTLIQTTIRAAILPGLQVFFGTILPLIVHDTRSFPETLEDPMGRALWSLRSQIYPILGWVMLLLCTVTMRRENGLKGIHEIASGTWVRRDRRAAKSRYETSIRVGQLVYDMPEAIGDFKILGDLGAYGDRRLWFARDENLKRTVWVMASSDEAGPSAARRSLDRTTRLRWLRGGALDGYVQDEKSGETPDSPFASRSDEQQATRWDAFEAFEAGPFAPFTNSLSQSCRTLALVANELDEAVRDGTLPEQLTHGQVWIDANGTPKLLDWAETQPIDGSTTAQAAKPRSDVERAIDFLQQLVKQQCQRPYAAGEIHDLHRQLPDKPREDETLRWAGRKLREMGDSDSRGMTWDERFGLLAISATLEWAFLNLAATISLMALFIATTLSPDQLAFSILPLLFAMPLVSGYFFHGGAVFAFAGVRLRRLNGEPASRTRSVFRTVLAWTPACLSSAALAALLTISVVKAPTEPENWVILIIAWIALGLLHLVGAAYAVLSPKRNLPDFVTGTYLSLR